MFSDELGKEFVRNALAISGKYLYLSAEDQDIAYRDERTWSAPSLEYAPSSEYATSQEYGRTRCSSA